MRRIQSALSIGLALASPLSMAIMGAAIALILTHGGRDYPDSRAVTIRAGRAIIRDDGAAVHVGLKVGDGDASTALTVHGARGEEVATLRLYRHGGTSIEGFESDRVRLVVHRSSANSISLGVHSGRAHYLFRVFPEGNGDLIFTDAGGNPVYGTHINAAGEILPLENRPVTASGR